MSISTNDISDDFFRLGNSDSTADHRGVPEGWKQELEHKIIVAKTEGSHYLHKYVPSVTPYTFTAATGEEFDEYKPAKGREGDNYSAFITGLDSLVSSFPAEKRLPFLNCHTVALQFPYSAFAAGHHASHTGIAVSFPGQILDAQTPSLPDWSHFSMTILLNAEAEKDPRNREFKDDKTLVQLAVNARNLFHAHGFLASFAICVYGDIFHICRFDHSCAVVSRPLPLRNVDGLRVPQQFLWRFANPIEGTSVVGSDPTVRRLTPDDEEWLKKRLHALGVSAANIMFSEARRAEILDENDFATDAAPPTYMLLKALDINGRLFSRATTVWLGIRDTRRLVNGRLVDLPVEHIPPEDLKLRVIKDTWRQLDRRPEKDFYTRLARIPSRHRVGLPSLVCGGDLGRREVRRWEAGLCGAPTLPAFPDHRARLLTPGPASSLSDISTQIRPTSLSAVPKDGNHTLHRPLQQTFTWRQERGPEHWHRERSHVRLVVDKVGRPLSQFRTTRELVTAVRDAIRGHRLAMTRAGILHRDVSVNNILIVDEPEDQASFAGFIHDFDYSWMSCQPPLQDSASSPSTMVTELLNYDDRDSELQQKRGTFYFMAIMLLLPNRRIHGVHHDLESFYWVLLWIVLQHTDYDHPAGEGTRSDIFKHGAEASFTSKLVWLHGGARAKLSIRNNLPLTRLLKEFGDLCARKVLADVDLLDYHEVLEVFDRMLDSDEYSTQWQVDDASLGERHGRFEKRADVLGKRKRKTNKRRVPESDSETDMDDENTDFEFYADIDKEDGPVPAMPPAYGDPGDDIIPSGYAYLFKTDSSPLPHVFNIPRRDVSFVEACEVEALLDLVD